MTQPVHPQVATQRKDTSAKKPAAETQPSSPSPPPPLLMFFMLPLTIFPSFHKSSFIEVYFTYSEFTHFKRSLMRWSHVIPTVTIKNTCVTPKLPSLPNTDVLSVTGGLSQDFTHTKSHSVRDPTLVQSILHPPSAPFLPTLQMGHIRSSTSGGFGVFHLGPL